MPTELDTLINSFLLSCPKDMDHLLFYKEWHFDDGSSMSYRCLNAKGESLVDDGPIISTLNHKFRTLSLKLFDKDSPWKNRKELPDGYIANRFELRIYPNRRCEVKWWFDHEIDDARFQKLKPRFDDQQDLIRAAENLADYKQNKGRSRRMRERAAHPRFDDAAANKASTPVEKPPEPQEPIEPGVLFNTIIQAAREAAPQGWEALAIDGEIKQTEKDGHMLTEVSADFQARMPDGSLRTIHVPAPIAAMNALSHLQKHYPDKNGAPWQRIRIFCGDKANGSVRCVFDQPGLWAGEDVADE